MTDRAGPILSRRQMGLLTGAAVMTPLFHLSPALAGPDGTVVLCQPSDVPTLDPTADSSPIGVNVRKNIFSNLTDVNRDGSIHPDLATSWTATDNATVWTFTIRTDAKFHDGTPVTVDDIVWTYEKIRADAKSPMNSYLAKVKTVEKIAPDKVRITLVEPFSPFDRQVTLVGIVPKAAYEKMGAVQFAQTPVGSGPYKVIRWVKDDRIEAEVFPQYFGGEAKIKKAQFKPVPSDAARASALVTGELDVVPLLPPALIERLSAQKSVKIVKVGSHKVIYMGLDVTNSVLSDVRMRQAIDMAIDRTTITGKLLRGMGNPIGQVVAPVTFGYDPTTPVTAFDPAKAKDLVKQAGYKGDKILFQYPTSNFASADDLAQAIAGYLQAVGINVELQQMEYSAFFALWAGTKLTGIHLFSYGPTSLDADLPLTSLYETGRSRTKFSDPKIDELVRAQRAEADPTKRKALLGQIWLRSRELVPYVNLYNEIYAYGIHEGLDWEPWPNGMLALS